MKLPLLVALAQLSACAGVVSGVDGVVPADAGSEEPDASSAVDASVPDAGPGTDKSCEGRADGTYCGGRLGLPEGELLTCAAGAVTRQTCPLGCRQAQASQDACCACVKGEKRCSAAGVPEECRADCSGFEAKPACAATHECRQGSCEPRTCEALRMVQNPPLSQGSGRFFVIDFDCAGVELYLSPINGSAPNQSSYRSTLAKFLADFDQDGSTVLAFNTNFSQPGADPITGAYVYQGAVYEKVYLTDCSYSNNCPTKCAFEDTRYSIALSQAGKLSMLTYSPAYDFNQCLAQGCQGCLDYNWLKNEPIKYFVGTKSGVIPVGTRSLFSGMDISVGVPHHGGTPDPFVETLGARNVVAKVKGHNKLVVGLLSQAYRTPVRTYVEQTFNTETVLFFDGGGSTKQYIKYQGVQHSLDGTRQVPSIVGVRLR